MNGMNSNVVFMTRVLTVIGARPQWMKASALSRALKDHKWGIEERVLHTGQHYSDNMAGSFVKELDLPRADHALTVSTDPAERMGQMMGGIQDGHCEEDNPDGGVAFWRYGFDAGRGLGSEQGRYPRRPHRSRIAFI